MWREVGTYISTAVAESFGLFSTFRRSSLDRRQEVVLQSKADQSQSLLERRWTYTTDRGDTVLKLTMVPASELRNQRQSMETEGATHQ